MLNIAVRAARAAGRVLLRHVDRVDMHEVKSKGNNNLISQEEHKE
ncbi:MAG: inositol monophosphatase, partial [Gammaproteobacteria bacterium]